jgi:hypothetical protein
LPSIKRDGSISIMASAADIKSKSTAYSKNELDMFNTNQFLSKIKQGFENPGPNYVENMIKFGNKQPIKPVTLYNHKQ